MPSYLEWLRAHELIRPARANTRAGVQAEPITRAFGLPRGTLRTGASLAGLAREAIGGRPAEPTEHRRKGDGDVAIDRRAA